MTYRLRNIIVAVVLALVAALLTSFYVTNYQRTVRQDETNVPVFVAAKDIPVGTAGADLARGGMLTKADVVKRSVVPGAITDPAQLDRLVASQQILAGEQVTTRRFATPSEQGVSAQLKGTMRALQVPGDANQLLAGTLKTGDRIDIVASLKVSPDRDEFATRIVLRDIEVLQSPTSAGTDVKLAGASSLSALLAVTDTQVQKLFHVLKHAQWSFQLRPGIKSADSSESVAYGSSILTDGLRGRQLEELQRQAGGSQ